MSATSAPFGLRPAFHPSGLDRAQALANGITSGLAVNILKGQPITYTTAATVGATAAANGTIIPAGTPGNSAATSGYQVAGAFDGVEFTDSQGRRSVGKWISKAALDASTDIVFWIFQDPNIVYEAQINGSANASSIGKQYDFDATNTPVVGYSIGNGGAGFSQAALEATANSTGTQGQVRVVGLGREVAFPTGETNQWGDAYTIVQVTIANNSFVAPKVSV
jgi:hypothetical protein